MAVFAIAALMDWVSTVEKLALIMVIPKKGNQPKTNEGNLKALPRVSQRGHLESWPEEQPRLAI